MAGIVVPCRQQHHLTIGGDLLDEGLLRLVGQEAEIHGIGGRDGIALGLQILQQGADAGVGVLHIVHRVLAVLPDGQTQIELHLRLRLGVEEVAAGVHGDLVQQVRQADGLAGALGHPHHLAVPHQLHQLHQHDIQPVLAVQPQSVHGTLQAGHMAVVVGAPDVDDLIEAPDGEFVAVIGNIGGEVGVKPVGTAQHVVLQAQLLDVLVGLAGLFQVLRQDPAGGQPQGAVLLIGIAPLGQRLHGVCHIAALVEGGLEEPCVVLDAVPGQIGLHLGDVVIQTEFGQRIVPGLFVAVQILLALLLIKQPGQLPDIVAMIAVLRELNGVLAADQLLIPGIQAPGKLVDLVTGVVDVELPPHVGTGLLEYGGQRVAQHAATGVAHVHGAGGVGGDELHHVLLSGQRVVAPVVGALRLHTGHGIAEPAAAQPEVQKTGAGQLHGGEIGVRQVHLLRQDLGHLPGVHLHGLGGSQAEGGGIVAVGGILGDLHRGGHRHALRQQAGGGRLLIGGGGQGQHLVLRALDHIHCGVLLHS